jgi:mannan endo-1,4-beta-mannosidase
VTAVTVSGSATVGGVSYPVTASLTLASAPVTPVTPAAASCLLGVYDPANDWPSSWTGEQAFISAGCPVKVATYYVQWNGGFPVTLAADCLAAGVTPFVEMEPWFTSTTWPAFTDISAGKYDSYLQTMAQAVVTFGHPVMFTYAHEMNGSWYPWGNGGAQGVTEAQWVASWQHVVSTMNAVAGAADLITWVWAPNNADVGSVVPYWPGEEYVGLAGWDGYLQTAGQTFANFLQQTLTEIRTLTSGPVWLSETGIEVTGSTRAAAITTLVGNLQAAGVDGFMWFNEGSNALTSAEISALATAVSAWNAG